ncbi:Lipopolysaccharide core heptosyltransferase RfaQ [bacterium HR10]|nr:Lipopolysaccharide core heptosyltransferase RfaQ [bacterium HR10]
MPRTDERRILVIHVGALGDCVLALPALAALDRRFPGAHIELAGHPSPHGLLERRSAVDRVVSIEALGLHRAFSGKLPEDLARYLRDFDVIVSWFGSGDTAYRRALESLQRDRPQRLLIARSTPPEESREHAADYLLRTLAPLGITVQAEDRTPRLVLLPEDHEAAEQRLRSFDLEVETDPPPQLIAVHPGSGSRRKCWPIERFAHVIRALEQPHRYFLLIEGPADTDLVERLIAMRERAGANALQRLTALPLPHLAAILARCHLFIGNDSGVTHLAAAVGAPVIAIFTATDPARWGPRGRAHILRGDLSVGDVLMHCRHVLERERPAVTRTPRSHTGPIRSSGPR